MLLAASSNYATAIYESFYIERVYSVKSMSSIRNQVYGKVLRKYVPRYAPPSHHS